MVSSHDELNGDDCMIDQDHAHLSHPYRMYEAIHAQPSAIDRVLNEEGEPLGRLARRAESSGRVLVVGIGTSWHAALVGEHLLRTVGGLGGVRAWNSFEFNAYRPELGTDDLVIVLSHRGTKRYSARALASARSAGAVTAVVTALGSAVEADLADIVVRTSEPEVSAAFTISHTAAMTALAMLAREIGSRAGRNCAGELAGELDLLPRLMEGCLRLEPRVRDWVEDVRSAERFYFAGWGPNVATAYEVALKIKETSYRKTEGFELEQYLHGPFVATHPGVASVFIVPSGPGRARSMELIAAVNTVGGHSTALIDEGDSEVGELAATSLSLPRTCEAITPITYLVPLQLFTYWLAVETGSNPDTFRLDDPLHDAARDHYQL